MPEPCPKIDDRDAAAIESDLKTKLAVFAPEWDQKDDLGNALIKVCARFGELIIERLNRAPEKNFLAFLDMLGAAQLPPQAARVPLTFSLAAGSTTDAVVPAGTRVSAQPAAGEAEPVVFETERELVVTAARLTSAFVGDPGYALAKEASTPDLELFWRDPSIEHNVLYLGHDLLFAAASEKLTVTVTLGNDNASDPRKVEWSRWDGTGWTPIIPTTDSSDGMRTSGPVVFDSLPVFSQHEVNRVASRWLRCCLKTPVTKATAVTGGYVREAQLPTIKTLELAATYHSGALPVEAAFANAVALDLGKDFFPFGERPKFGDVFYFGHHEVFSRAGAMVVVTVMVTDPKSYAPDVTRTTTTTLAWEYWDGQTWQALALEYLDGQTQTWKPLSPEDKTTAFAFSESGTLTLRFTLPAPSQELAINGVTNRWVRVRITSGGYGEDAHYSQDKVMPSTLVPPSIESVTLTYTATVSAASQGLTRILWCNDGMFVTPPMLVPFRAISDDVPSLYLGFDPGDGQTTLPNRPLALYFDLPEALYGGNETTPPAPRLAWEYRNDNDTDWVSLAVVDDTAAFTRSGVVQWLPPPDWKRTAELGLPQSYWLRVRLLEGGWVCPPTLRRLLLNTTMAAQTVTVAGEILGSSDGSRGQRFRTNLAPVLSGQRLQVREPEMPSRTECKDLIGSPEPVPGPGSEVWVPWSEVSQFHASTPRDRHYLLDHLSGEIRFGDGLNGLIPPRGIGNVRMASYQTGGGARGNRPAGTVTQLKTAVPFVDRVSNIVPASGGADAESLDSLRVRAPRMLRHGDRAVAGEDYEDLARLASPEVARAKCIPVPRDAKGAEGPVTVIVMPRSVDAQPIPSRELLRRVQAFLDARRLPGVKLRLRGPEYRKITVTTTIVPSSIEAADTLKATVQDALARFLHPLTGGPAGTGWQWGRQPEESALYRMIQVIAGVDHVHSLSTVVESGTVAMKESFMIASGGHQVTVTLANDGPATGLGPVG